MDVRVAVVIGVIVWGASASAATASRRPADAPLVAAERAEVVAGVCALLETRYVTPDVAAACAEHLRSALDAGMFDAMDRRAALAEAMTAMLQSTGNDRHLHLFARVERLDGNIS